METETCCLGNYTASEAAGSNADDPSWLELVPWRNKQLATGVGAAASEPSNCNSRMNMAFSAERTRGEGGVREKKPNLSFSGATTVAILYAITLPYIIDHVMSSFDYPKKRHNEFLKE